MTFFYRYFTILSIALAVIAATSCNKDDVITPDEPEEPAAPAQPFEPRGDVWFASPSMFQPSTTRFTFAGRPVYLTPEIGDLEGSSYVWTVNDRLLDEKGRTLVFTPERAGDYEVKVTVDGVDCATVKVVCVAKTEAEMMRGRTSTSTPTVCEWVPAPGQFINETTAFTTLAEANAWAQNQLDRQYTVSLGAFGGYIIVKFPNSVRNVDGQPDFGILGNAFLKTATGVGGSNEPGIVYVMQDVNGNGQPDDEWYQLRGCETGNDSTIENYAVTYYKPGAIKTDIKWSDNRGAKGSVDYVEAFHAQDSYYPAWVGTGDSFTLRGTRLKARTERDAATSEWSSFPFEWGYADNVGNDVVGSFAPKHCNGFDIGNAMYADCRPVKLAYIDFVKVQTGVNAKAGHLGEVSTEVCGFVTLR